MKLIAKFNGGWITKFKMYCLYNPTRYHALGPLKDWDARFYVLDYKFDNVICKVKLYDWGPQEKKSDSIRYASRWFFKIEEDYPTEFQQLYLYNQFCKLKGFKKNQLERLIYVIKI